MIRHFLPSAVFLFAIGSASGATLATYSIPAQSPTNYTLAAAVTSFDPLITASSITSAMTPVGSSHGPGSFTVSNSSGQAYLQFNSSNSTLEGAITDKDYLEFSITVAGATVLDVTGLTLSRKVESTDVTSGLALLMSLDGFATVPTAGDVIDTITTTSATTYASATFNITNPAYQGLTDQTVTFRIYGYDDSSASGFYTRIDNFSILGSVPEPASALLGLLAAPLFFLRRSRR